ncbi:MAG: pyridoxamine 5'-phosphate oxidase [Gemmatimonadota bacterium]|jgi:pyridoxamine 5'-phosphate oxidase|nr:pyridoxamine 5'-phosphate oxidase [Gemmatimonadota bacterium]
MSDPVTRVAELLDRAARAGVVEPNAMALATVDSEGRPSVRMVLLKGLDDSGFVFFTNLESRKGEELRANPHAALCFHWREFETQVRVEGAVELVTDAEADAYFASRPRGSRIGAWASEQSRPLPVFEDLERRVVEVEARYEDQEVPRPPFWSGFRLTPATIEIWSGKPSRLHLREVYQRSEPDAPWEMQLLYP